LNSTSGVVMEVEGPSSTLDKFLHELAEKAPPSPELSTWRVNHSPKGRLRFEIRESQVEMGYVLVSPDMATCDECRREIVDPNDRRYRTLSQTAPTAVPVLPSLRTCPMIRP